MTLVTKLKKLSRLSHFMLDAMSVTLRTGSIYFNASAVRELKLANIKAVTSQLRIMSIQGMQQKYMSSSTMIQSQSKMHLLKWVKD